MFKLSYKDLASNQWVDRYFKKLENAAGVAADVIKRGVTGYVTLQVYEIKTED